jgi:hypothetical protein
MEGVMTERIFVCFDRNMEKRVFNMREGAERVAVGEIEEYVNMKVLQPLITYFALSKNGNPA